MHYHKIDYYEKNIYAISKNIIKVFLNKHLIICNNFKNYFYIFKIKEFA